MSGDPTTHPLQNLGVAALPTHRIDAYVSYITIPCCSIFIGGWCGWVLAIRMLIVQALKCSTF